MTKEDLAKQMYDIYCEAVGGLAFNGDKLPGSEEFFADETKLKQVNAWRKVADQAPFISQFKIGEEVCVDNMGLGSIVGIKFSNNKVYYDILMDSNNSVLSNIFSENVFEKLI